MRTQARLAVLLLLALTATTLIAGYALKAHCADVPWDGTQYRAFCYSDAVPLYHHRHLDEGATPYLDLADRPTDDPTDHPGFLEYPILTGLVMWTAARLTTTGWFGWETGSAYTFLRYDALLLAPFAILTTLLLYRMTRTPHRALLFALGPPLLLYAFHNWDLVAVAFLVLAIERLESDRPAQAGAALALGGAAKLFPLVAAPFLFLLLWRCSLLARPHARDVRALARSLGRARAAWTFAAALVLTLVVVHLPLYLAGGGPLYEAMFRFHAARDPNFESLWYALPYLLAKTGIADTAPELAGWSLPLTALGFAALAVWIWRRTPNVRHTAFAPLLVLLMFTKVFSIQYVLWILPLFALVRLPGWSYLAFVVTDLAVFTSLYMLFADFTTPTFDAVFPIVAIAVLARAAALGATLYAVLRLSVGETPIPQTEDDRAAAGAPVVQI